MAARQQHHLEISVEAHSRRLTGAAGRCARGAGRGPERSPGRRRDVLARTEAVRCLLGIICHLQQCCSVVGVHGGQQCENGTGFSELSTRAVMCSEGNRFTILGPCTAHSAAHRRGRRALGPPPPALTAARSAAAEALNWRRARASPHSCSTSQDAQGAGRAWGCAWRVLEVRHPAAAQLQCGTRSCEPQVGSGAPPRLHAHARLQCSALPARRSARRRRAAHWLVLQPAPAHLQLHHAGLGGGSSVIIAVFFRSSYAAPALRRSRLPHPPALRNRPYHPAGGVSTTAQPDSARECACP